jgi:hypothetical protein
MKRLSLICLLLLCCHGLQALAETCDSALIIATTSTSNSKHSDWRLSYNITKENYDEVKRDLSADVVVYDIPIGLDYNDYSQKRSSYSKNYGESLTVDQAFSLLHTGLDKYSLAAYKACLEKEIFALEGIHVKILSETENDIDIYVRVSVPNAPRNSKIEWSPATIDGKAIPSLIGDPGAKTIILARPKAVMSLGANFAGFANSQPLTLFPHALPPPVDPKSDPQQALFVGLTENLNRGDVCVDHNYKGGSNLPIGYTMKAPPKVASVALYSGTTPNVNQGAVSIREKNFMHGDTTSIGYVFRTDPGKPGSQALYAIKGPPSESTDPNLNQLCTDKGGLVSTNDKHLNCATDLIGWTLP